MLWSVEDYYVCLVAIKFYFSSGRIFCDIVIYSIHTTDTKYNIKPVGKIQFKKAGGYFYPLY